MDVLRRAILADLEARTATYAAAAYIAGTLAVGVVLAYLAERARVQTMVTDTRTSLEGQGLALVHRMDYARSGEHDAVTGEGWEPAP